MTIVPLLVVNNIIISSSSSNAIIPIIMLHSPLHILAMAIITAILKVDGGSLPRPLIMWQCHNSSSNNNSTPLHQLTTATTNELPLPKNDDFKNEENSIIHSLRHLPLGHKQPPRQRLLLLLLEFPSMTLLLRCFILVGVQQCC